MKKSRLLLIAGWAHKEDSLDEIARRASEFANVETLCIHDLLASSPTTTDPLEDVFSPAGPSVYAERLFEDYLQGEPAYLLGWSMGAMIALETAYYYPHAVKNLILASGTASFCTRDDELGPYEHGVPSLNVRNLSIGLKRAPKLTLVLFMKNVYWHAYSQARFEQRTEDALSFSRPTLDRGLRYLSETDLRGLIGDLEKRVLILHGEEDKIIPPGAAKYLDEHLRNPELHLLENGSHALCEQFPVEVTNLIRGFLKDD